jgi:hypothetical protein
MFDCDDDGRCLSEILDFFKWGKILAHALIDCHVGSRCKWAGVVARFGRVAAAVSPPHLPTRQIRHQAKMSTRSFRSLFVTPSIDDVRL